MSLLQAIDNVLENCADCGQCGSECPVIRHHGLPGKIAHAFASDPERFAKAAFECSLCGLCRSICPRRVDTPGMFLAMRKQLTAQGRTDLNTYRKVLNHERRGVSQRNSYHGFPDGCDTVYFPGCTFSGTRFRQTIAVFEYLQSHVPGLGIVLDCCTRPSHDLGRTAHFHEMFGQMKNWLVKNRIKKVLVNCPSCYKTFEQYGHPLEVETVYEVMAADGITKGRAVSGTVSIHDPCAVREHGPLHRLVRELVRSLGIAVVPMEHEKQRTLCCGQGGSACLSEPAWASHWLRLRKKEAQNRRLITYCAGCADSLKKAVPTSHLIDLMLFPEQTLAGKITPARAPMTYLNRLRLKRHFKNTVPVSVSVERPLFSSITGE